MFSLINLIVFWKLLIPATHPKIVGLESCLLLCYINFQLLWKLGLYFRDHLKKSCISYLKNQRTKLHLISWSVSSSVKQHKLAGKNKECILCSSSSQYFKYFWVMKLRFFSCLLLLWPTKGSHQSCIACCIALQPGLAAWLYRNNV